MYTALLVTPGEDAFIGLTYEAAEGTFVWLNGDTTTEAEIGFASGEPNNLGGNENCVVLNWLGDPFNTANDIQCSPDAFALCERILA